MVGGVGREARRVNPGELGRGHGAWEGWRRAGSGNVGAGAAGAGVELQELGLLVIVGVGRLELNRWS